MLNRQIPLSPNETWSDADGGLPVSAPESAEAVVVDQFVAATGRLVWAIRESFVRYVTLIARGEYTIAGGVTEGEDGQFAFPLRRAVQEGDDWRLSFGGSVHFVAHHGLLDVLIVDPELVVGPGGGVLATHVRGDADELIAMVVTDAASPEFSWKELVWQDVPTKLATAGAELLGNVYPKGTDMASLAIRVQLDA
ncbi:HtaA domain-containing protein [Rhodococcus globerulus]|uniref:HtaA domain-containing protein n=1 Tax=Rhodococcus globerulus TaxID=33008 RepID=UPI000A447027|nr:HtaA domain-containing protein [Rhodococcus globerulus]